MPRIIPRQLTDGKLIRQERRYGKYMRSFNLGADVREADTKASFKDGALKLQASAYQHGPDYLVQQALLPRNVYRVFQVACGQ